ncbi:MAG: SprT-like domain-containing protein [Eubacterium ventriosum]
MKEITSYNRAVQYLNKVFKLINAEFFNDALDMPTITVQSTAEAYGHITVSKVWTNELGLMSHELNVSADYLDRPMENVVATLIHEGCHLYAIANGIKDTSNHGVYHNRKFKELAEARGLKITRNDKYGWTITEPTERIFNFCEAYGLGEIQITRKKQLSFIGTGNIPGIGNDNSQPPNKKRSSYQRWICPSCHTIIRSTKNVNIICGDCGEHFIRKEKESGH